MLYPNPQLFHPVMGPEFKNILSFLLLSSCRSMYQIFLYCRHLSPRKVWHTVNFWMQDLDAMALYFSHTYSHCTLDPNAKSSDTNGKTFSIRWFCIQIERVMTVYENYDVIAFKSCIQIFTMQYLVTRSKTPWQIT